jgi:hypothetical protein
VVTLYKLDLQYDLLLGVLLTSLYSAKFERARPPRMAARCASITP